MISPLWWKYIHIVAEEWKGRIWNFAWYGKGVCANKTSKERTYPLRAWKMEKTYLLSTLIWKGRICFTFLKLRLATFSNGFFLKFRKNRMAFWNFMKLDNKMDNMSSIIIYFEFNIRGSVVCTILSIFGLIIDFNCRSLKLDFKNLKKFKDM